VEQHELAAEARAFADRLRGLFNKTVCHGLPINGVTYSTPRGPRAVVGYDVASDNLAARPMPIHRCKTTAALYAIVSYTLAPDEQGQYPMVVSSTLGLALDAEGKRGLFHADYERDKADGYPETHLQVYAGSDDWDAVLAQRNRSLGKLHLPAGGRRYRSTAEDLIEFLIAEDLAEPREGWQVVLQAQRKDFEERQLRAAVRANPSVAREALRDVDEQA